MANTTADKLALLATNKANIKAAINAKNPTTAPTDVMSQWPTAIASIPSGSPQPSHPAYDPEAGALGSAFKVVIPEDNFTFTTDFLQHTAGVQINWGDGETSTSIRGLNYHTYARAGTYVISIPNVATPFNPGNSSDGLTRYCNGIITEIIRIGTNVTRVGWNGAHSTGYLNYLNSINKTCGLPPSVTSLRYAYTECVKLIVSDDLSNIRTTNCDSTFNQCASLKYVSQIDLSLCKTCYYMFNGCSSLMSLPSLLDISSCENCAYMFCGCSALTSVPTILDTSSCKSCNSMFRECRKITSFPSTLNLSSCTDCNEMFRYCKSVTSINITNTSLVKSFQNTFSDCSSLKNISSEIDFSAAITMYGVFQNCFSLENIPDVMDLSSSTNNNNSFTGLYCVKNFPTHLTAIRGISFQDMLNASKDSLATFDANGDVIGGMVYNLNTCPTSGQTMTFGNTIKAKFTASEWTAIKAALTAKNWGCSPA